MATAGKRRARRTGWWRRVRKRRRLAPGGEVILATGAIGTPQILQLSGIGPAPLLQARGIAVRRELAGVGENLQDHLQIRAVFGVEGVQTLNGLANSLWARRRSPCTTPGSAAGR
jgi:choline dehydrogenase